jgi:hypothetical protein
MAKDSLESPSADKSESNRGAAIGTMEPKSARTGSRGPYGTAEAPVELSLIRSVHVVIITVITIIWFVFVKTLIGID